MQHHLPLAVWVRDSQSGLAKSALDEAAGFADVDLRHFTLPVPIMGPHIAGVARG